MRKSSWLWLLAIGAGVFFISRRRAPAGAPVTAPQYKQLQDIANQ